MKKNRPATKLSVICSHGDREALETIIFEETGTLGIRRLACDRTILPRTAAEVSTAWGPIAGKVATMPNGSERFSPEYEACRAVAEHHQISIAKVLETARQAFTAKS